MPGIVEVTNGSNIVISVRMLSTKIFDGVLFVSTLPSTIMI